jgi:hypothetical protein
VQTLQRSAWTRMRQQVWYWSHIYCVNVFMRVTWHWRAAHAHQTRANQSTSVALSCPMKFSSLPREHLSLRSLQPAMCTPWSRLPCSMPPASWSIGSHSKEVQLYARSKLGEHQRTIRNGASASRGTPFALPAAGRNVAPCTVAPYVRHLLLYQIARRGIAWTRPSRRRSPVGRTCP